MKKRFPALLLCFLLVFAMTACNNATTDESSQKTDAPEQIETEKAVEKAEAISLVSGEENITEYDEDTYYTFISATYPAVFVHYGDEEKYPELAKSLKTEYESDKKRQEEFIKEHMANAKEAYEEKGEDFYNYESLIAPFVRRADTVATSVLCDSYVYLGGAHGDIFRYGENYDTKTGKKLELSDVIADKDKLISAVNEQLEKFCEGIDSSADIGAIIDEGSAFSWTLDYNGITLYFMSYAISSGATGIPTVTISNEEYPDVFKKEYMVVPASYGVEILEDAPYYYDVTGDGEVDEIVFSAIESDFGNDGEISITVNDSRFDFENWFYEAKARFVHTKNGKNYIYVETVSDNDYRQTLCYELYYGVKDIGYIDGGIRSILQEGDNYLITYDVLTNPESFYMDRVTQHISTDFGSKNYHIGENGIPESDDVMYKFDEEYMIEFTLLMDINAEIYNEKTGEVKEAITLKAGDKVHYYGTDDEKYAYLKCKDGAIVRIKAERGEDDYMYKIEGKALEEVLDGLFFAG